MKELELSDLSAEQKIGQLIVARCGLCEEDKKFIIDMAKKKCVGGIQMCFSDGYKEFIDKVRGAADYPLLVCADMENGYPGGSFKFPLPIGISSTNDPSLAYQLARLTAIEAKRAGINVVWGPVVDIAREGALCKISRCFGDDIERVCKFSIEMIKGFQDEGMVVTAKHFPGGSDLVCDPHMKMEASMLGEEELMNKDIIPYLRAMKEANLSGIMSGHGYFPKIDDKYVASLSPKIIGLIRKAGFDGIIMTDSLAMMAIVQNYNEEDVHGLAIAAGNDMILPNYRLSFKDSYNYLLKAYKKGIISDERLDDAVRHVIEAQHKTLKKASMERANGELRQAALAAKEKSLCALNAEGYTTRLSEKTKKLFVLLSENEYPGIYGTSKELTAAKCYSKENALKRKEMILKEFPGSEVMIINEFPCQAEIEAVCQKISECDEAIFYVFCIMSSYLASDGITDRIKNLINANMDKISAIIHIGNPYEIKKYNSPKRILAAAYADDSDKYLFDALKGRFIPTGKIPLGAAAAKL